MSSILYCPHCLRTGGAIDPPEKVGPINPISNIDTTYKERGSEAPGIGFERKEWNTCNYALMCHYCLNWYFMGEEISIKHSNPLRYFKTYRWIRKLRKVL